VIEPPHGVTRYTAAQPPTEELAGAFAPLPNRRSAIADDLGDEPRVAPDVMGHRYEALAAWSESAATMTMAAVATEPLFPYPRNVKKPQAGAPRHAVPPAGAAPRDRRRRRARVALLAVAGVAAVTAVTIAAVTIQAGADDTETPVSTGVVTAGGTTPPAGEQPLDARTTTAAAATAPPSASGSAGPPSPSLSHSPSASARSSAAGISLPTGKPSRGPLRTSPAPAPGAARLSATYGYRLDESGFSGTVQVVNSGGAAAPDWAVSLAVPGAEQVIVTAGDVTVSQTGNSATFRPSGTSVAASGSVSFSFTLDPAPADPPSGCSLDGEPCS
jgi:hypothetical protein